MKVNPDLMKTNPDFKPENKNGYNAHLPFEVLRIFEVESYGMINGRVTLHFDFENGQLINLDTERNKKGAYNAK
jgi:hypothetical protein